MIIRFLILAIFIGLSPGLRSQELVFIDQLGVLRWEEDKSEVALFGANYCLPSACDYRAAGYVGGDRKQMIKEDLDHFKRMGWDALRLCFWGDYQNTDINGNLIENDHLDLLNFLIAEADKRNIYMLFSPIVTYSSQWPDAMSDTTNTGFAKFYPKHSLYKGEKAIQVQENYWKQILNYQNPYTQRSIKDEPKILFVELINEPTQNVDEIAQTIQYINRLHESIKSTGCKKPTFYNVSQNFGMAPAIAQSKVEGSTYAWYPMSLNSNRTFEGNGLLMVDRYEEMLHPQLANKPKIVYEFDSPDMTEGYIIPAMVREFRRGGVQLATLFSYDMLRTASMNLGWQTHYINLVYTPSKAVSSMIAAEVMRQVPRGAHYGYYPTNNSFGDFTVDYDQDLSELNGLDKFYYSNTTISQPKDLKSLKHIAGVGSSPVVNYSGNGVYFLDKKQDGSWILEVYPDIMELDDPFKMVSPGKTVRKAAYRERDLELHLPDLTAQLKITPGIYHFKNGKLVEKQELPQMEFFESPIGEWQVVNRTLPEFDSGSKVTFNCEVYGDQIPEKVNLFVFLKPWGYREVEMDVAGSFNYKAEIEACELGEGYYDYHVEVVTKGNTILFPAKTNSSPKKWDYYKQATYKLTINYEKTPLSLLGPDDDWSLIRFTRTFLSPEVRFQTIATKNSLQAYQLTVDDLRPDEKYWAPCDATFSQFIGLKIPSRNIKDTGPKFVKIRASGLNDTDKAYLTIVDKEGRGYGTEIELSGNAADILVPVEKLRPTKAVMLPQDWPGVNSYWYPTSLQTDVAPLDWGIARFVQISLRDELYEVDNMTNKGIVVENIELLF